MSKIQVLLVDDHELFSEGMKVLFDVSPEAVIYSSCKNGMEFLDSIEKKMPDVVLMDINMPVMNGIEATRKAVAKYSEIKIIALSMYGEEEYLESMLDAGAKGFLVKNTGIDELERAIKTVYDGKSYFSSDLLSILMNLLRNPKKEEINKEQQKFSERELEILQLICDGMTNQEIGDKLFISPRTVDGHRANIISKAEVKNTAQLVTYAIRNGFYVV
ncbi:MAG: DNA-binding response regulator [Bacteroidetes bacterium HGW-Bacteroidetes-6]|jgi:DNA-binding NarL/FixJ family response regulator|nr:MAG: DNA-binding response regulator [Bacteroidetes bacterium HGW-Bacteroidetes-6]